MAIFYHPATNGFYHEDVHGPRLIPAAQTTREIKAGKRPAMVSNPDCLIPEDAVEISAERYRGLIDAQSEGMAIVNRTGKPVAVKQEEARSPEEIAEIRRLSRDRRLASSDWTQLPDSPLSAEDRALWAEYRQALRDFDPAADSWPIPPGGIEN